VSDKASTCPHCGCPLRYSANATTDLTTDSSGEEEIGTESRRVSQRRQKVAPKRPGEVITHGLFIFVLVFSVTLVPFMCAMGEFEHGGSFDWFSTEPEVISLKEFVKKTPSTYDDLSLDSRPVKDIAVIKSTKGPTGSHVDEIKSTISGVEYVFDILGRQADRADSLAPGDKIEFTALVDTRGGNETDRNLRGFGIERVISMVSHTDCTRCAGSGIIVLTHRTPCYSCGGDGRLGNGTVFYRECVDCDGYGDKYLGQTTSQPCSDCQGSGLIVPQR
jgi:hypothetical protein